MKRNNTTKIIAVAILISISAYSLCACSNNTKSTDETSFQSSINSSADESQSSEISKAPESSLQNENSKEESKADNSIPNLPDPTPSAEGEMVNGLFIYNNAAFELFYGSENMAKNYANTISNLKKALGDDITVYNIIVPTHIGIGLPERFSDISNSQEDYLNTISNSYSADIVSVNTFNTLMHHRDEYLYFNTDHHWTALAAYYAYSDFAKAAGIDAIPLESMEKNEITNYTGSLASIADIDCLYNNPDTVVYYKTDADIDCTLYDGNAENPSDTMLLHEYAEGVNAYGVFLGGDNDLMIAKNPDGNGQKIAVIKESYGNAFAPYIAYTYGETHIIDFRYFNVDLKQYLKDNGITQVIFINNAMASATDVRCEELAELVK